MPAIKIDTLAIAKELEESGIPVKQAEAQTRVYAKVLNMVVEDQLATKQDLTALERKLEQEFAVVKQDVIAVERNLGQEIVVVKQDIATIKQDIGVVKQDIAMVRQDVIGLERKLDQEFAAVKQDVAAVDYKLTKKMDDFERLFIKLESEIQTQTLKITVRLGGLVVAGIVVLAALMKL